jgi:signal transduction histidine kinase
MNARARGISEHNLHERLALEGPNDELTELANTFDGMLARLEGAFESQRRFVANASHELRTPITVERTLVEVALADPDATVDSLRATCERVLAASEQQERLIEALLTLARSQRGLDHRAKLDLSEIAGEVVQARSSNGVVLQSSFGSAPTTGDPALIERLIANLLDNAIAYNTDGGWARTWTGIRDGKPTVTVANSGGMVPLDQVDGLLEPFRRLDGDRTGHPAGLGLGLSIVGAIAAAHGAELGVRAREEGGLEVEVRFLGV